MIRRLLSPAIVSKFAAVGVAFFTIFSLSGCGLIGATATTAVALIPLKLYFACLPEGTAIDTPNGPKAIESLRAGDLVTGYDGDPVKVLQVHGYLEDADESEFYSVEFSNGATVKLCSMHRIQGIRAKELSPGDALPDGSEVKNVTTFRGVERSYDILTEDKGYQIGGIAVNSMIEEMYAAGRTGKVKR